MLARLVYAYKLDPRVFMECPGYLVDPLVENLETMEALEQSARVTAATVPYMKEQDRRRVYDNLSRATRDYWRMTEVAERDTTRTAEGEDKQKAIEYFEQIGVKLQ